jgi:hypothetical protein
MRTRSRSMGWLAAPILATASAVALAQAPPPAPAPAPAGAAATAPRPAAAASAPAAAAPKPAAELDQVKFFEGSWRCDGKAPAGPAGPEHGYKSTFKVKKDLDGFWYSADYEQKKAKDNPMPIKARGYMGYDAGSRKFIFGGFDNAGGMVTETSLGWEGDKFVSSGEGTAMGQRIGFRETFVKKGDRELTWMGELRMGKDWMVIGNDTCKK